MPCPHFRINICCRSNNGSAVASSAYMSGERIFSEYDSRTKNYKYKAEEVVYKEIILPDNAPQEYADRGTLWNAIEEAEPNWNSQLARRFVIALPKELSDEDNINLLREYIKDQFTSEGMIADFAIHRPKKETDNIHAHLMLTMRPMDEQGKWMPKSKKEYITDASGNPVLDKNGKQKTRKVFTTNWDDRGNAEKWRKAWETIQNSYLEKAGRTERVCLDSFAKQGIDLYPTVHMGPAVCAKEERGEETQIGALNRLIKEINNLLRQISEYIKGIGNHVSETKQSVENLEMDPMQLKVFDLCRIRFEQRAEERKSWAYPDAGLRNDLHKKASIFARLGQKNISTIADLEKYLEESNAELKELQKEKKSLSRKKARLEGIIKHADRKKELDSVYKKAHGFGFGKKKYAEEHAAELEEWKSCVQYLKINLKDEEYNPKQMKNELTLLELEMETQLYKINTLKDDLDLMRYTKNLIKDLIPELQPTTKPLTEAQKDSNRRSINALLQEKKKEVAERERVKEKTKKRSRDERS